MECKGEREPCQNGKGKNADEQMPTKNNGQMKNATATPKVKNERISPDIEEVAIIDEVEIIEEVENLEKKKTSKCRFIWAIFIFIKLFLLLYLLKQDIFIGII